MKPGDRPARWHDSDVESEHEEPSGSDEEVSSDSSGSEDDEPEYKRGKAAGKGKGPAKPKAPAKRKRCTKGASSASTVKYAVQTIDGTEPEADIRSAVEKLAGKRQSAKEGIGWAEPPEGWNTSSDSRKRAVYTRKPYEGPGFSLKRQFTDEEARDWTELDSWRACHGEEGIPGGSQRYY